MKINDDSFYIYGAGIFGKALVITLLAKGFRPKGILDRAPKVEHYQSIPIIKFEDQSHNLSLPVLVTVLGYPELNNQLSQAGFITIYDANAVMAEFPEAVVQLNQCGFLWMQEPAHLQYDAIKCPEMYRLLSDQKSRQTFTRICNFRQFPSADHYPWPESYEMYFPADIPGLYNYEEIRLLDVGAYNGDSLQGFYDRWPHKISQYTGIEISINNIESFWKRRESLNLLNGKVKLIRGAVGVPAGQKLIVEENESATKVRLLLETENVEAEQSIEHFNLGDIIELSNCNILKMDIEGADYAALDEAVDVIVASKPTLALSVYHRPQDLWEMALLIENRAPAAYKWYIRQEGHWGLETICYGVPR